MKKRRTRWYNSLTLRLLLLFWILLFLTASSGFVLALWQTKAPQPEPLAADIRQTLEPLLSDPMTFASLQPGRLVAGDYRVVARLMPTGNQRFRADAAIEERHRQTLLRQIDAEQPEQLMLETVLLVGPFELEEQRLLLTRPLSARELRQQEITEREAQEARAVTLLVGSGVFAVLLGVWLVRPIHRLIRATREVAAGSAKPTLKSLPKRRDEIGELARALQTTAYDLAVSRDAQRRLLSDVSHELRSPLARMQMALSLSQPEGSDIDNPHLQQLELDLDRLGAIIDRILSLSRLENGLVSLNKESLDTGQLVQQLIADLCYVDASCKERLVRQGDDWPVIDGDSELLRLVVENLVRNALQYTDGKIYLSAQSQPASKNQAHGTCMIIVHDEGEGVEPEQLAQLFEPFYRADPSRHHKAGVGLGMALSQRATGVLGGTVTARNHPDGGLEVTITLPLPASS